MRTLARIAIFTMVLAIGSLQAQQPKKEVCETIDAQTLSDETCAAIHTYLTPKDQLGPIMEDGEFLVISPGPDGKTVAKTFALPPKYRTEMALNTVYEAIRGAEITLELNPNALLKEMIKQAKVFWPKTRDLYCYYHTGATYSDLDGKTQTCLEVKSTPDDQAMEEELRGSMTLNTNLRMQENVIQAEAIANERSRRNPPVAPAPVAQAVSVITPKPSGCTKNISFATSTGGQVATNAPEFATKWAEKNQKKYPGLCFNQNAVKDAHNYVLVFSNSQVSYMGLFPTVRTSTSTDTSPVSGSGTLTDNYGGMWQYTYTGTMTTTTTTTTHENVPYEDRSSTGYIYCYAQNGVLCGQHSRTVTTRRGGDPYNTLGYNLGARLSSIHLRERLLKEAVQNIVNFP